GASAGSPRRLPPCTARRRARTKPYPKELAMALQTDQPSSRPSVPASQERPAQPASEQTPGISVVAATVAYEDPDERARAIEAQMTDEERFSLIISLMGAVPGSITGPRDSR